MRALWMLPMLQGCLLLGPPPFLTGTDAVDLATNRQGVCVVYTGGRMSCTMPTAPNSGTWAAVDATDSAMCGVRTDGRIDCWGSSYDLDELTEDIPRGDFVDVRIARNFGCALDAADRLECWGSNANDEVTGTPDTPMAAFDVSGGTGVGLSTEGKIIFWGEDANDGEYSYGYRTPSLDLGLVYEDVAFTGSQACALTDEGQILCWGDFEDPWQASGGPYTSLTGGVQEWGCGVTETGGVDCFGRHNDNLEQEAPEGIRFELVDAGYADTCGWTDANELFCWGGGEFAEWARP